MGSQAAQNWLLLANLVALGIYVWFTRGIKKASLAQSVAANAQAQRSLELVEAANKQTEVSQGLLQAANEQSEGLSKPYVTVCSGVRVPPHPTLRASLKTAIHTGLGLELRAELLGEFVELLNLGNGPALELSWRIGWRPHLGQEYEHLPGDYEGFVPYAAPKEIIALPVSASLLDTSAFTVVKTSFKSLSARSYAHTTWLEGQKVISSTGGAETA